MGDMKRRKYTEGPDAKEKFEGAMKAIFRAPKGKKAEKPKAASPGRKSDDPDKD